MEELDISQKQLGSDFDFRQAESLLIQIVRNRLVSEKASESIIAEVLQYIQTHDHPSINAFFKSKTMGELFDNTGKVILWASEKYLNLTSLKMINSSEIFIESLIKYPQNVAVSLLTKELHSVKDAIRNSKIGGKPVNKQFAEYYLSFFQDKVEWAKDSPELFNSLQTEKSSDNIGVEKQITPLLSETKESKVIQFQGTPVSLNELALIVNYLGKAGDITDTNWHEKSQEYGLNPSRAIYNNVRKWDTPEKRQLQTIVATADQVRRQIARLNKIKPLIPNTVANNTRFNNDMKILLQNNF